MPSAATGVPSTVIWQPTFLSGELARTLRLTGLAAAPGGTAIWTVRSQGRRGFDRNPLSLKSV
jgi:hypothetical protein